jgi:glyoxylase-like metal-dependent hydrolase (beta-lactamase superfamily II)
MKNHLSLEVYHGLEASVNAYLFYDHDTAVLVDCLRNSEEAKRLAGFIKSKGKKLTHVLITHGHPDHYIGMNIMKREFPDARIVVTRQEIKSDIAGFSTWMESVGWLEKEPAMKPKSTSNPEGFDYENSIAVLDAPEIKLSGGASLKLNSDYQGAECEHLTTIYSEDLNAFFTGDFCYNQVHMWLAVDKENRINWKSQLDQFKKEWSPVQPQIYPGHGAATDITLFDKVKKYIESFEETIGIAGSRDEAMERMKGLYPHYREADFLLLNSVNALIPEQRFRS